MSLVSEQLLTYSRDAWPNAVIPVLQRQLQAGFSILQVYNTFTLGSSSLLKAVSAWEDTKPGLKAWSHPSLISKERLVAAYAWYVVMA